MEMRCMDGLMVRRSASAVVLAAGLAVPAFAQTYEAVPLGSLGGTGGAAAQSVNDHDEVVGWSDTNAGVAHAFFWSSGVMIDLGTLGGASSRALSINNARQVVGGAQDVNGVEKAVIWERDIQGMWHITDLGTLPGGTFAVANDISENGKIAGLSSRSGSPAHGFLLAGGVMTDLGILNYPLNLGHSEALGVNDAGQTVGYAYAPLWGPDHAFYYQNARAEDITPPGQFTFARGEAINQAGIAAGILILPGGGSTGFEAAVYTPGQGWNEIGVLAGLTESEAYGINDGGTVVGHSFDLATQVYRAFVWSQGTMADLNLVTHVPVTLDEAPDVSNLGSIAANAQTQVDVQAFLLRLGSSCYANCDQSTTPPVLNVQDFACFLNQFAAGDTAANCDGSTTPPVLNVQDFSCFLNRFAAGCS
jgi:probable HAF family extracellular repeat protein